MLDKETNDKIQEEDAEKIKGNWPNLTREEQIKYRDIFPLFLEDRKNRWPELYISGWCHTAWEVQEFYQDLFPCVFEMAESAIGMPYIDIWRHSSPNIAEANPEILENALREAMKIDAQSEILAQLYLGSRIELKQKNPELFNSFVSYIKKFPELVVRFSHSPIMQESFSVLDYSEALKTLADNGEDISKWLKLSYPIKPDSLEVLKGTAYDGDFIFQQDMYISIKDASELPLTKLDEICGKFSISEIRMESEDIGKEQREPYTVSEFAKCREIIDEILTGINIGDKEDTDREKKVFGQVIKRLAQHMKYDYSHLEEFNEAKRGEEEARENYRRSKNLELSDLEERKEELRDATIKRNKIDMVTPRNMVGGLINRTCVCAGYAEIVRNVFSCLGIEARFVYGFPEEKEESGHAWNQIKLDGLWYNMDLTWDRDLLVEDKEPRNLLQDTTTFNLNGHGTFSRERSSEELCHDTVSSRRVKELCAFTSRLSMKTKCINWLKNVSERCRLGKVQEMGNVICKSADRLRGKSYDKDERDR